MISPRTDVSYQGINARYLTPNYAKELYYGPSGLQLTVIEISSNFVRSVLYALFAFIN